MNKELKAATINVIDEFLGKHCSDDLMDYCHNAIEGTDVDAMEVANLVSAALNTAIDGLEAA